MKVSPRKSIPRVALLVETTRTYTRELLAGIRRYFAEHGAWSTYVELRALDSAPPTWLRNWDGDGILTRTFTKEMSDLIISTGLPAVELRSVQFSGGRPLVGIDNAPIGEMVARHFYDRGYRQFGAYTLNIEPFFEERVRNFVRYAEEKGCPCFELPETDAETVLNWENNQARLIAWLEKLPKPIGIFAANDLLGVRLLDACQRAGIGVPEDVAVVGAENEETLCSFSTPPLSSVRCDGMSVGYAAAQILDRLMAGETGVAAQTLFPPKGIVERESSNDCVLTDRLVACAVRLIRENAMEGLNVEELATRLNVSRSTLERRMCVAIGRSPKDEIARVRFGAVDRLLKETDLTIDAIAFQTGFSHSHYLQAAYKKSKGMTPGEFRRIHHREV